MRISAISGGLQTPPPSSLYYTLSIMLFPNLYFFEGIADVTVNPICPLAWMNPSNSTFHLKWPLQEATSNLVLVLYPVSLLFGC